MATDLEKFYLNSPKSVAILECIELSHPNFLKTYYVVRNSSYNISVKHEDDPNKYLYIYYPLELTGKGSFKDLDFGFTVKFGDLEGELQKELEVVAAADGFLIHPIFKLRRYRSDNLEAPIESVITLIIRQLKFNAEGAEFEATARLISERATGRLYDLANFPQMKAMT